MRRSAAESSEKSPRRECAAVSCGPARSHGIRNPIRDRGNALDKRFRLLLNSHRCLPPQRQLQIRAAAPPRFLTNLGFPAEDIRKQAGHRPAFLVFGKREKSPTNRPHFEVVPPREHTTKHTPSRLSRRSRRIRREPENGPKLLQFSLSASDTDARNRAVASRRIARWQDKPDRLLDVLHRLVKHLPRFRPGLHLLLGEVRHYHVGN